MVSTSLTGPVEPLLASAVDSKVNKANCGQIVAHVTYVQYHALCTWVLVAVCTNPVREQGKEQSVERMPQKR